MYIFLRTYCCVDRLIRKTRINFCHIVNMQYIFYCCCFLFAIYNTSNLLRAFIGQKSRGRENLLSLLEAGHSSSPALGQQCLGSWPSDSDWTCIIDLVFRLLSLDWERNHQFSCFSGPQTWARTEPSAFSGLQLADGRSWVSLASIIISQFL